jgi:hypothetical protein
MTIIAIRHVMGLPSHRRMERIMDAPSVRTDVGERSVLRLRDVFGCTTLHFRTEIDID